MAEFFSAFPSQNIQAQKPMSIGDMINVGRTGIALQKESQENKERLGLQEFFSNPENFQTDGNLDMSKVNAAVPKIAPMTGRAVIGNFAELSKAQTEANRAKQNLTQDQKALIGQTFNILGKAGVNDRQTYMKALDDLVATNPENKDLGRLADSYKIIWGKMPEGTNWAQLAVTGAQTLLPVPTQETQFNPQPGTLNTGAQVLPTVTRPSVAGQAPTIQVGQAPLATNQLGPNARYVPTGRVDMNNNPTALAYGPNGELLGEVTIPAGANTAQLPGGPAANAMPGVQPGAQTGVQGGGVLPQNNIQAPPVSNAPARLPAGESGTTLDAANKLRIDVRNAAGQAPVQNFNNNQIIKLADDVITGKGANFVGALSGGYAAIPWTSDNATNLNQLGHYMALQTSSLAQSSGLGGTDAGRAIAGQISGTTDWTPQAIKQTARVNRALTTGTELFNQGIDNAFNRTKNPFSATEFQQRWTQTLGADGINAVRLYDAMRNNDKEAIREVVTAVGGPNSQGYKNLVNKIGAMQKLIGGQ